MSMQNSILKTLVYADIFDFPLAAEELWRFLIVDEVSKKLSKQEFSRVLKSFLVKKNSHVTYFNNYYFIIGRKFTVVMRQIREKESKRKMVIARNVARFISFIPTVQMICVSGALAVENATEKDDIDFFIITNNGTIWLTRLLVLGVLQLLGKRRRWGQVSANDKICVNMLIDESSLSLPSDRHDVYTAHEIAQLRVLFERKNIYKQFIAANTWVRKFLPNAFDFTGNHLLLIKHKLRQGNSFVIFLEKIAKAIQFRQIQKHQTTEIISDTLLAFHPFDYREYTLRLYKKRYSTLIMKSSFDIMI